MQRVPRPSFVIVVVTLTNLRVIRQRRQMNFENSLRRWRLCRRAPGPARGFQRSGNSQQAADLFLQLEALLEMFQREAIAPLLAIDVADVCQSDGDATQDPGSAFRTDPDLGHGVAHGFNLAVEVGFESKPCQAAISEDVKAVRSADEHCVVVAEHRERHVRDLVSRYISR